jgi:hypothetical protein
MSDLVESRGLQEAYKGTESFDAKVRPYVQPCHIPGFSGFTSWYVVVAFGICKHY